jgi:RNA polymerase sigma-54 factor
MLRHEAAPRQTQTVAMTQRMQQSVRMLQMGAAELGQFVRQEAEANPFLEAEGADAEETAADDGEPVPAYDDGDYAGRAGAAPLGGGEDAASFAAAEETLCDRIAPQIAVAFDDPEERAVAFFLAGNLDRRGYLAVPLEDVAEALRFPLERCASVLRLLQKKCEPVGVFARDLGECLRLQLEDQGRWNALYAYALAHPEETAGLRARGKSEFSDAELDGVLAVLRTLNPFPGDVASERAPRVLIPDCYLLKTEDGGFRVALNERVVPKLRLMDRYYAEISASLKEGKDVEFVRERRGSAQWLIGALKKRQETFHKVASAVAERQKDFFLYGVRHLRPLTLADVAAEIGVHESTVSRAVSGKCMAAGNAVYDLKFFFGGAVGGSFSSAEAVKRRIREIIDGEPKNAPLSDQAVADRLGKEGVDLARRTVVKYREEMRIPAARRRKG